MSRLNVRGVGEVNFVRTGPVGMSPLMLLHPVGLDLTWWGEQFRQFSTAFDVIAIDMPGHGLSAEPADAPSFEMMADVVQALVDHLNLRPVHLVGLSVGGMIAQAFALRCPQAVASLALVATLCTFPPEGRQALAERARVARNEGMKRIAELSNERWFPEAFRVRRPDVTDRVVKSLSLQRGEFHARMWDMIAGLDFEARLSRIECPTLIVTGDADINAPAAAAEKIAAQILGSRVEIMPGIGHFPPFEEPEAFNTLLRSFLDRVERDSSDSQGSQ